MNRKASQFLDWYGDKELKMMTKVQNINKLQVCFVFLRTTMHPYTWLIPIPAFKAYPLDHVWKLVGEVWACCWFVAGFSTCDSR
jgi:hypothetical protein